MLPGELQAKYGSDPGYQNFLRWIAAGGKHGDYTGMMRNEAAVRETMTPWGENKWFDSGGNEVSLYRPSRPGEVSPYKGPGGPSAPEWTPGQLAAMFVPDAYKAKNLAPALASTAPTSLAAALAKKPGETEEEYYRRIERERGIA